MANEDYNQRENIYSTKVRAGKRRTYFFDVRKTKGDDYYLTITESTKKFNDDGYERHKIFLYKEDFNRFMNSLNEAIDHVKTELMPDFDYEIYERRQKEWEESLKNEGQSDQSSTTEENSDTAGGDSSPASEDTDDDISW